MCCRRLRKWQHEDGDIVGVGDIVGADTVGVVVAVVVVVGMVGCSADCDHRYSPRLTLKQTHLVGAHKGAGVDSVR